MIACTWLVSTSRSTPLTISVPSSSATCRFSSFSNPTSTSLISKELREFRPAQTTGFSLAETLSASVPRGRSVDPARWYPGPTMTGWTSPTHIILLLLIALLLFGAKRLPEIGRSLGSGMREFKDSVTGKSEEPSSARRSALPPTTTEPLRGALARARARDRLASDGTAAPPPRPRRGGDACRASRGAALADLHRPGRARASRRSSPSSFHTQILDWLNAPLPAHHRKPVTLGVAEPLIVSVTVSVYAGVPAGAADHPLAGLGVLRAGVRAGSERRVLGLVAFATVLAALRARLRLLRPPAARSRTGCTSYDTEQFHNLIQAKPYYSFVADGAARRSWSSSSCRWSCSGSSTSASSRRRSCGSTRRMGYFITPASRSGCPGSTRSRPCSRLLPMWILFEARSGLPCWSSGGAGTFAAPTVPES